ncbi:hypothetical protein EZS27_021423 [termite gut metagenome]|uniref:Fibrobacter succinogenes major paralogous domain-containing protein n=1 Tax=termite gut metagenome TaxID=433724 RepID=A0A5J4R927_9ZZZZ
MFFLHLYLQLNDTVYNLIITMKVLKLFLSIIILSICLLTSCKEDQPDVPVLPDLATATGNIIALKNVNVTRTNLDLSSLSLIWSEDDAFGVFYLPGGNNTLVLNNKFTLKGGSGSSLGEFSSSTPIKWVEGEYTLHAVYPYQKIEGTLLTIPVSPSQTQIDSNPKVAGTTLIGSAESVKPAESIQFNFSTPLAIIKFAIDAKETDFTEDNLSQVIFSSDVPFVGEAIYNLETGVLSTEAANGKSVELTFGETQILSQPIHAFIDILPVDFSNALNQLELITDNYSVVIKLDHFKKEIVSGSYYNVAVNLKDLIAAGAVKIIPITQLPVANTYLVKQGDVVHIPVSRAYDVWKDFFNEEFRNIESRVSAELIWQDHPSLISSVTLYDNKNDGRLGWIDVKTSGTEGNALVSYTVDGVVRWSWQIWITEYDPDNGGKTYELASVSVPQLGHQLPTYVFMDRNLGALNTTPGDLNSYGYMYQWGRKDPFPPTLAPAPATATDQGLYDTRLLYDMNNTSYEEDNVRMDPIDGTFTYITRGGLIRHREVNPVFLGTETNTLRYAINEPTTLYFGGGIQYDWYGLGRGNDDLWNDAAQDNSKSVFDPSPYGWRIPYGDVIIGAYGQTIGISPFEGLRGTKFTIVDEKTRGIHSDILGYIPWAGQRNSTDGGFRYESNQTVSPLWCATPSGPDGIYLDIGLPNSGNQVQEAFPAVLMNRAVATMVRCVRYEKEKR